MFRFQMDLFSTAQLALCYPLPSAGIVGSPGSIPAGDNRIVFEMLCQRLERTVSGLFIVNRKCDEERSSELRLTGAGARGEA
jgi:hypothetical protein